MTWPAVFDGIGAMFVRCDNDPDQQLARIPGVTWVAVKVNGSDITPPPEIKSWLQRAAVHNLTEGLWVYCYGPPSTDIASWQLFYSNPAFVIYDVEKEYKTDESGPDVAGWPAQLVKLHPSTVPAAVTSYGAIPGNGNFAPSIDFAPFAAAGWPILAQLYGDYGLGDERTYMKSSGLKYPGPYPAAGVHRLLRQLKIVPGDAVYRPEGI